MTQSPKHLNSILQGKESNKHWLCSFLPYCTGCQKAASKGIHCIATPIPHLKRNIIPWRIQVLQDGDLLEEFTKMLTSL